MKTIRRTVIARERDYVKLCVETLPTGLYDRIDAEPFTYQDIKNDHLLNTLKNPGRVYELSPLPDLYKDLLYKQKELYNYRYRNWTLTMDYPNGSIYVQSRAGHPHEMLYRVTLEKDVC